MKYLVIGNVNVAFCSNVNEVATALYHRGSPECRVYASDEWEDLTIMARIVQQRICDNRTDANGMERMALPATVTESVFLTYRGTGSFSVATSAVDSGEWAISALNGFCTAQDIQQLCQILAGGEMVYPVAQWFPTHEEAVDAARSSYVARFYNRYKLPGEETGLPPKWVEFFVDAYFQEREKRRLAQLETIWQWQRFMNERGWR